MDILKKATDDLERAERGFDFNKEEYINLLGCKAECYALMNDYERASNLINRVFKLDPYHKRALLYRKLGNIGLALNDFHSVLFPNELNEDDVRLQSINKEEYIKLLGCKAQCYEVMKDYDRALNLINRVLKIDPHIITVLIGRACLYRKLGNVELALDDIQSVLLIDHLNEDALRLQHMINRPDTGKRQVDWLIRKGRVIREPWNNQTGQASVITMILPQPRDAYDQLHEDDIPLQEVAHNQIQGDDNALEGDNNALQGGNNALQGGNNALEGGNNALQEIAHNQIQGDDNALQGGEVAQEPGNNDQAQVEQGAAPHQAENANAPQQDNNLSFYGKAKLWFNGHVVRDLEAATTTNIDHTRWFYYWMVPSVLLFTVCELLAFTSPTQQPSKDCDGEEEIIYSNCVICLSGLIIYLWTFVFCLVFKDPVYRSKPFMIWARLFTRGLLPGLTTIVGNLGGTRWEMFSAFLIGMIAIVLLLIAFRAEEDMGSTDMMCVLACAFLINHMKKHLIPALLAFIAINMGMSIKFFLPNSREYFNQIKQRISQWFSNIFGSNWYRYPVEAEHNA